MTSMIETVAAACRAAVAEDRGRSVSFEEMSFIVARAAIEAMREPTEAVMAAINEHAGSIAPEYAWRDGIDAALSEETR